MGDSNKHGSVDLEGFATIRPKHMSSKKDGDNLKPSIPKAWDHFMEGLPRRGRDPLQPSGFRLCRPGELYGVDREPAVLYRPYCSSHEEFAEFGVGISLYFVTLKYLCIVLLICSLLLLQSLYANQPYNPNNTPTLLLGSTVGATLGSFKAGKQGQGDLFATFVLLFAVLVGSRLQQWYVRRVDKEHLTPSDYTVRVDNPPRNITDPMQYYKFFSKFGDVVLVTVALNNGKLAECMGNKKLLEEMLLAQQQYKFLAESQQQVYKDQDKMGCMGRALQMLGYLPTLGLVQGQLDVEQKRLQALAQKDYRPWQVYITFAKQSQQRRCLKETAVSYYTILTGNAPGSEANMDGRILNVDRASEPNDILFENSSYSRLNRYLRVVISYLLCAAVLAISSVIVTELAKSDNVGVAVFVSVLNSMLPVITKTISWLVERPISASDAQMSTLLKLVIVRCINSGVLIYLSVGNGNRFGKQHLNQIQGILIADAVTTPITTFLDISGLLNRHVLSRYVATQDELNVLFSPADWTLAERYTDMLKTIFIGLLYAVPLPSGLFITSICMFTTYLVDNYSLMRRWKRVPHLDESLASVARDFLLVVIFAHINVSKNYFANWPQNTKSSVPCTFFSCDTTGNMTKPQLSMVKTYNGLNIAMFVFLMVWMFIQFGSWIRSIFTNHAVNMDTEVDTDPSFRELSAQSAYVPVLQPAGMSDPVIMTSVAHLPQKFLPITRSVLLNDKSKADPENYCAAKVSEFPAEAGVTENTLNSLFTQVRYFEEKLAPAYVPMVKPSFDAPALVLPMTAVAPGGHVPNGAPVVQPVQPPISRAGFDSVAALTSAQQQPLLLPEGWVQKTDPHGKVYYANTVTKTTTWTRPV